MFILFENMFILSENMFILSKITFSSAKKYVHSAQKICGIHFWVDTDLLWQELNLGPTH